MATLLTAATGNFNTAATWGVVDATSLLDTETNSTASTTAFVSSQVFMPGAITIDAIALKIVSRNASPTGTFSVRLAIAAVAVAGTTVTINVADLPVTMNGWATFKLAAPVLLLAATNYEIQIQSSTNARVTVYRNATAGNWARMLRTTTTGTPAAGDNLNITGEYTGTGTSNSFTVTMDNTAATVFNKIETSGKGTLAYGTTASTNYQLICGSASTGSFYVNGEGIVTIGTSGTPMPSTSTGLLQINQTGVAVTNGIFTRANGNFTTFGSSKTLKAFLDADAAAAATSLTTDITTSGWVSGDSIAIASTTRTASETESKALTANASGTTLTISAITNAHSGTGATKAEVANLTRNVKISGETTSLPSYISVGADSIINFSNTEVFFLGSGAGGKRGVDINTVAGSFTVDNCVWREFTIGANFGFLANQSTNANISITNVVIYNVTGTGLSINSTTMSATTITVNNILAFNSNVTFNSTAGTFTNITSVGSGITIGPSSVTDTFTCNNLVVHSTTAAGLSLGSNTQDTLNITTVTAWRCTTRGIQFSLASNISIDGLTVFGNGTTGVELSNSSGISIDNGVFNAGTTLTSPSGISLTAGSFNNIVYNSTFGATTTHATGDVNCSTSRAYHTLYFQNCLFGSTTEVANQVSTAVNSMIGSSKHDQTTGTHKLWRKYGITSADNVINFTPTVSGRATPTNATYKLNFQSRKFAIPNGKTAKVSVAVRKSVAGDGTAYNGNLPRLILKSNNSAGISADVVLATATAASVGAFETISGTTAAVTDNTILEVYVDCDGTTGWINEDNWKVQIIDGAASGTNVNSEDYWNDGMAFRGLNTLLLTSSGSETYWFNGSPARELFPISAAETGRYWLAFE